MGAFQYKKVPKVQYDVHVYSSGNKSGKGKSGKTKGNNSSVKSKYDENLWKNRIVEAATKAKERGQTPAGMERYIDELLEPKLPWKQLLMKYITREIPHDYTWMRPSKKSFATGIYMPSIVREGMELVTTVDTSGSMGRHELSEAMGEISAICQAYPFIKMTVIICDAQVHRTYDVTPYNTQELKKMVLQGGGGTSHVPVYNWLEKNKPNARLVINLTDGYTDFPPNDKGFNSIWVISSSSEAESSIPFGTVLKLPSMRK